VGLLGSRALAGQLAPQNLQAPRGGRQALLEGFARAGLSETGLLQARRDPAALAGYLELHIEQGPRLFKSGVQVGVVTAIVGIASQRLVFHGSANHAGTTPMEARRDAGLGASGFALAARQRVMEDFPGCVVNIGAMEFEPGAFNVVPGQASLALELRAPDEESFDRLEAALLACAQEQAERFGLEFTVETLGRHAPAPMHAAAQQAVREAAEGLGLSHSNLVSGAGHDAQSLAAVCPSGMIFIPSVEGISHAAREFSRWEDCVNGANVLLGAALNLAQAAA
jgi:beta-ureidopropionase / N-carbamoyl-L-amino-acid hydrolase